MSSMQGQKSTSFKAVVLTGLLLLAGSSSASFVEHSNHQIIAEPKLLQIPSYRGHGHHHPHGSHLRRNKASVHQKRMEGVVVEVPYTIWTGTFEELRRRSPSPAKDDEEEDTPKSTEDSTSEEDICSNAVCPKGYYCTKAGCCPNGKKCTGIATCLDATDSQCPDNLACCPDRSPICTVKGDQGYCMKQKAVTTTSEAPKSTSTHKADVTTTTEHKTTSTTESSTSETSTTSTTVSTETPAPTPAPTSSDVPVPVPVSVDQATPTPDPVAVTTDVVVSTTSTAPTASATAVSTDVSTRTKVISSAVAGSIVAIAFGSLIIYAIVQKRKENALARAEEASKDAPLAAASSAAPMGTGGNGRPLSIQPEPEMLQMATQAPAAVFTSGPQQGRSLRDGIPPPSPPPNAMVVGTPPYRRENYEPGTPTSLRVGVPSPTVPQQAHWGPAVGYPSNFPLPDGPLPGDYSPAGYSSPGAHTPGTAELYTPGEYSSPGAHTPSTTGSYQAYSPPSTPGHPPSRNLTSPR